MNPTMRKSCFVVVLSLAPVFTPVADAALVLTFTNSVGHAAPVDNSPCTSVDWPAGTEFRWCDPTGTFVLAPSAGQDAIYGGETWTFSDADVFTSVTGTPGNLGATFGSPGSAAPMPGTNPTLQQNTLLLGAGFSVLAPVQGSLAGNAYGTGSYVGGVPVAGNDLPFIYFPVLEGQFNNSVWFKFGSASGGVTFFADISNIATYGNATTFDFHLHASEMIDASEGEYVGLTVQWELQGTGTYMAPVPVPAAVWLFGSGLLGLAAMARRKKKN